MRGLYIGRFQPYHLGHQAVIHKIVEEVDEVVIAIGSAQVSHTPENPFTAGERMTMIYGALEDLRDRCYIIPLQDVDRNAVWATRPAAAKPIITTPRTRVRRSSRDSSNTSATV